MGSLARAWVTCGRRKCKPEGVVCGREAGFNLTNDESLEALDYSRCQWRNSVVRDQLAFTGNRFEKLPNNVKRHRSGHTNESQSARRQVPLLFSLCGNFRFIAAYRQSEIAAAVELMNDKMISYKTNDATPTISHDRCFKMGYF